MRRQFSDSSFYGYAPLTFGILGSCVCAFAAAQIVLQGTDGVLPWIGLAETLVVVLAIVWWFSRFSRTVVHVQRKSIGSRPETKRDFGGRYHTVEVPVYHLYTDLGPAIVGPSLFRKLEEGVTYELMTKKIGGELFCSGLWPAKRV